MIDTSLKFIIIIMIQFLFVGNCIAQNVELVDLLKTINWNSQNTDLYRSIQKNIEKCKYTEWKEENTSGEYKFKDVFIGSIQLSSAPIRINNSTKKIHRINFIINSKGGNDDIENKISKYISTNWENEIRNTINDEKSIIHLIKQVITQDYILKYSCISTPNDTDYILSIEPLSYYEVESNKIQVHQNTNNITPPIVESFSITQDNDIIIKEKESDYRMYYKKKLHPTQNGNIIFFEGGMVCYRPKHFDIVYGLNSFIASYPIKQKK